MPSQSDVKIRISAQDKTKQAFQSVNKSLQNTKKAMSALAGLGAGTAITALVGDAQRTIQTVDNLSVRINASATALSEYKVAAESTGIQFESFGTAMQRLVTRMGEASRGSTELQRAFKDLGLDINELSLLSADQAFDKVANAIQEVGNQAERQALTVKLLDTEGVRLLQTFGEIEDARALARDTGAFISQEEIDASDRLNRSITELKAEADSLGQTLVVVLEPALSGIFSVLGGGINIIEVFAKLLGTVGVGIYTVVAAFETLKAQTPGEAFTILSRNLADANALLDRIWESTDSAANSMQTFSSAIPTPDKFGAFIRGLKDQNEVLGHQAEGLDFAAESTKQIQAAEKALGVQRHGLSQDQIEQIQTETKLRLELQGQIQEQSEKSSDAARSLGLTMASSFEEAIIEGEKLSEVLKGLLKDIIQIAVRTSITTPVATAVTAFAGQYFAGGTDFAPGGLAMVGEKGPEIVNLPRGSQVIPNHEIGGMGGVTLKVDARGSTDPMETERAVRRAVEQSVDAIRDMKMRGALPEFA